MLPEFSHFCLILAFGFALLQFGFPLLLLYFQPRLALTESQTAIGDEAFFSLGPGLARSLSFAQSFFVLLSFLGLMLSFAQNDFSVAYVAANSNATLPLPYRLAAVWGAHEGSLLLWALLLSIWGTAFQKQATSKMPDYLVSKMTMAFGGVSAGFLLFLLLTSNPFLRHLPLFPSEGGDLNPLLQDPGLIFHPPILYSGYVGYAVTFAFAIGVLLVGEFERQWFALLRPFAVLAFSFLTAGITLGSFWAYYELGWGGYWFWDPVENASLMPWLAGVALLHTLRLTETRGIAVRFTLLLCLMAFALSLLGTFLVRSGVLTSVHAFASDPTRGAAILLYLGCSVGSALLIYALRAQNFHPTPPLSFLSRQNYLLLGAILLVVILATVMLGTLYPLLLEAFNLGKISVGPPYFNRVVTPLGFLVLFVMASVPFLNYKAISWVNALRAVSWTLSVALFLAIMLPFLFFKTQPISVILGLFFGFWVIFSTLEPIFKQIVSTRIFPRLSCREWGMLLAHLGVAVLTLGLTLVSHYSVEKDVRLSVGESVEVAGSQFLFETLEPLQGPNYEGVRATFQVLQSGQVIAILKPEKRIYQVTKMPISETAIKTGLYRDLYVALGEPLSEKTWSVRIYYKAWIRLLWLGGVLMMLGGLCVFSERWVR